MEELTCDEDLTEYVIKNRAEKGFLPKLKLINDIPVDVVQKEVREAMTKCTELMKKLSLIARTYQLGAQSQPIWYLMDEVGSAIQHSDTPNVKVMSFKHFPSNTASDQGVFDVSVMWPIKEIKKQEGFLMDFLAGFTEQKNFRSARLHTYFETPKQYYSK